MTDEQLTILDMLIETHIGLERQGPGSPEMTSKALGFLDDQSQIFRTVDMGCGTGGQTMVLAQNIPGDIIGVDLCPGFIDVFNDNAKKLKLEERVKGIVASMDDLSFQKEGFDLVWSEGAIDNIGFEKGVAYWNRFLKTNGYIAVTCATWLTDERPNEIELFWANAGCRLDTIEKNISIIKRAGYSFVAAFVLPEICWTENYFAPREEPERVFLRKHAGNKAIESFIDNESHKVELYSKYKQHY